MRRHASAVVPSASRAASAWRCSSPARRASAPSPAPHASGCATIGRHGAPPGALGVAHEALEPARDRHGLGPGRLEVATRLRERPRPTRGGGRRRHVAEQAQDLTPGPLQRGELGRVRRVPERPLRLVEPGGHLRPRPRLGLPRLERRPGAAGRAGHVDPRDRALRAGAERGHGVVGLVAHVAAPRGAARHVGALRTANGGHGGTFTIRQPCCKLVRVTPTPPYRWPDLAGKKVLVLGLGGGADVVTAYAVARELPVGPDGVAAYANSKTRQAEDPIARLLPPGPLGSPRVLVLDDDALPALKAEGFDLLVGVDTGGDVLADRARKKRGRDVRALELLQQVGPPVLLVVVGLGSDGQSKEEVLAAALEAERAAGRLLGALDMTRILEVYRAHAAGLAPHRTPNVILSALDGPEDERVLVPRSARPHIPRGWLRSSFVFTPA